ncbi:hypothetical protein BaRGS_00005391, partial [Batillaria attramentaria]
MVGSPLNPHTHSHTRNNPGYGVYTRLKYGFHAGHATALSVAPSTLRQIVTLCP